MRAILVCVDYADLLEITLPYNRQHFEEVCVVTSFEDERTLQVCSRINGVRVFVTDAFYRDGAKFNKWLALELALDEFGRYGWLCLMDADVLWPKQVDFGQLQIGKLYTPRRRMMEDIVHSQIPPESSWKVFPTHPQEREFAGYTQLFHADDLVLGPAPWHETNWRHAGGADSFFQAKWKPENKIRPAFEVLHLGPAGKNWCGRSTPYLDGSIHPESESRQQQVREFIRGRKAGADRFSAEKIG